jgi:hypothetical protein
MPPCPIMPRPSRDSAEAMGSFSKKGRYSPKGARVKEAYSGGISLPPSRPHPVFGRSSYLAPHASAVAEVNSRKWPLALERALCNNAS